MTSPEFSTPPMSTRWFDSTIELSSLGDNDQGGAFCIAGRCIDEPGPKRIPELHACVGDAVMKGHGDQWSVRDFIASYPAKNEHKRMYRRITAPSDGFLRIIPFTGCICKLRDLQRG